MRDRIAKGQAYEVETQSPDLTDESMAEARKLVGVWLRRYTKALIVSKDHIRQYAHSIGDDNPLFCDEEYAKKTKWGGVIAPPTYLYMSDSTIVAPGLRGIQWIYSGTDWEWFHPVRPGDTVTSRVRMYDATEHHGKHVPRMINQIGEILYYNQRGELVARAFGKTMRTPRAKASAGMAYKPRKPKWTIDKQQELDELYQKEIRRGMELRYWEDVEIGDELPPLHKGPLRRTEIALIGPYFSGEGENTSYQGAHIYQLQHRRAHPADTYVDPETGVQDHPHRGHWEEFMAREVGMPGVYDVGLQRIPWHAQLMTNWIGDDGFLVKLKTQLRRPNVVGDLTALQGKVVNKYVENGRHLVECELWAQNQEGENTVPGFAVASLPSLETKQS
jgi:acyl dehydratase